MPRWRDDRSRKSGRRLAYQAPPLRSRLRRAPGGVSAQRGRHRDAGRGGPALDRAGSRPGRAGDLPARLGGAEPGGGGRAGARRGLVRVVAVGALERFPVGLQTRGCRVAAARLLFAGELPAGSFVGGALALPILNVGHGPPVPTRSILEPRGRGGTGRRDGFRSRWAARPLEVRLLSPAPQERSTARRTPTDEFRR